MPNLPVPPVSSLDAIIQLAYAFAAKTIGGTIVPIAKYVIEFHAWLEKKSGKIPPVSPEAK